MSLYSSNGKYFNKDSRQSAGRSAAPQHTPNPRGERGTNPAERSEYRTNPSQRPEYRTNPGQRPEYRTNPSQRPVHRPSPDQRPEYKPNPDQRPEPARRPVQRMDPGPAPRNEARHAAPARQKPRRRSAGRIVFNLILVCLILAAVGFGGYTALNMVKLHREEARMQELAQSVHEDPAMADATIGLESLPEIQEPEVVPTELLVAEAPEIMMPEYVEIYEENNDLIGWILVDDTNINYPVMYSPGNPEKYLHMDFDGNYSFSGTPFLEGSGTVDSDQLLVYGHNMQNGTMFHDLVKYENKDFCKEHPVIHFDTLYHHYDFEVMAVLYERVYFKNEDVFKFYQFVDAGDEEEFDEAVAYYKEHSAYDTGVTAKYGDQLLALVTCAYHTEDGRLVVIAKRSR